MKKQKLLWVLLFVILPAVSYSDDMQRNTMLLRNDSEGETYSSISALSNTKHPQLLTESEKDNKKIYNSIDSLFKSVYEGNKPGGSILVLKNGDVFYRNAIGLQNISDDNKLSPENIFALGSLTKQFTAVCILLLEEQGKLSLDDDINKYLIDFPGHGHKIRIRHLLSHTSGYIDYFDVPEFWAVYQKEITVKEALGLVKDKPLQFTPGEGYKYSGVNYILLGLIIEKITGSSFEDYLQANIFDVLEMDHTYFFRKQKQMPDLAQGHMMINDEFVPSGPVCMSFLFSAGALYSNVDDMGKWINGLLNNKIIKRETLKRAWSKNVLANGDTISTGFGWDIGELQGHKYLEHGGSMIGYDSYHICLPEDSVYIIILTNSISDKGPGASRFFPMPVARKTAEMLIENKK
jgi:CubicO group peptidase (beta-lactamase class C family)